MDYAKPSLAELICEAISHACGRAPASVRMDSSLLELGVDSLTLVSVVSQVEALHGVEIETDDLIALLDAHLVRDLADLLDRLCVSTQQGSSTPQDPA